jgi:hypothetical protein
VESEGSVHSREIGEKKMPNRRVPEQSKVKWYQKTSLWLMCCKFVKWTTAVLTVNIPISRAIKFGVNNYLLSRKHQHATILFRICNTLRKGCLSPVPPTPGKVLHVNFCLHSHV